MTSVMADGRVFVQFGVKGGKRERFVNNPSEKAMRAIEYAKTVPDGKNTIPNDMTERQWERKCYRIFERHGIGKKMSGSSSHGLRHAYAQERYRQITGFSCRVQFATLGEFRENARNSAENWQKLDRDARQILMSELGHGGDRDDVISQYIGSNSR